MNNVLSHIILFFKVVIQISLEMKSFYLTICVKFMLFILIIAILAIFSIAFNVNGITINENFRVETINLLNNPQIIMLICFNVIIAILISYLMQYAQKSLEFFQDSPFEIIVPLLTFAPKQIIRNSLLSFIKKKR